MYDNSLVSYNTTCNGFISPSMQFFKSKKKVVKKVEPEPEEKSPAPIIIRKENAPIKEYSFVSVTNQIPVDDPKVSRRKVVIKTWGGSYSIEELATHLNVRLKTISNAVKGFKEVTLNGQKYTIENKLTKVNLYHNNVLKHSDKTMKEAAPLINRTTQYVAQLKNRGSTTGDGWRVEGVE